MIPPFPEAQTIPSPCQQRCEHRFSVVSPATARIHSACDPDDLGQAFSTVMRAACHQPADEREPFEVEPLTGHQRVPDEVRNDPLKQILESSRLLFHGLVAAVRPDASAPEVGLKRMKHLGSVAVLADGEARPHLPSRSKLRSRRDGDGEASFSVGITGDICREELATVPGAGV